MRRFLPTFLIIILVLAIYPFLGRDEEPVRAVGLPWQIDILPNGSTRVFGLTPGRTTLGQAVVLLGRDMELAVMVAEGETGSLEMFYSHYRSGLLSAKLVLGAELDAAAVKRMRGNAVRRDVLKSGTHKYVVSEQDHEAAFDAVIQSIAFIPATNLDHEMIINRFGEPEEVITMDNQVMHYLYPAKGLDVVLSEQAKDVLQYVAPDQFARLRQPLVN